MKRKWIPSSKIGQFFFFLVQTFISYFVICANFRSIAKGYYFSTAITDACITAQNMIVAKLAIEDKDGRSWSAIAGATVGGMLGSLFSIWVTKHIFGS